MRIPQLFGFNHRGKSVVLSTSIAAGFGFTLFGYDQGVMSGIITAPAYLLQFPETNNPSVSGITVAIYEIGCLFGAVATIWLGERLGRKTCIMLGMCIMIVGTAIMASSYSLGQFIVGRIVVGFGNGINTATIPTYQGECAPRHIRGALVLVSGALISGGITIAYLINLGFFFVDSSATWRFPIAFQIVFAFAVMGMLFGIPESPAWLIKHGHDEEARDVISRLTDVPLDDPSIDEAVQAIEGSLSEIAAFKFRDLFTNGPSQNFRRASLAVVSQAFQQLTGCNLITYYSATLFEDSIGLSPFLSRILSFANGLEYFRTAIVAIFLVDRLGRRVTMLGGALGTGFSMLVLCISVTFSDRGSKAASYVACVFLFMFNTFFPIGWLGSTWLYPGEITSLGIRTQANSLSTVSNWLWNFVIVMITPPSFASIGAYTYLIFAVLNLCLIFPAVYIFFPETKMRSLEEVDLLFAEAYNEKLNYVQHSINRPPIAGAELEEELELAFARGKKEAGVSQFIEHAGTQPAPMRRLVTAPLPKSESESKTSTIAEGRELKGDETAAKADDDSEPEEKTEDKKE